VESDKVILESRIGLNKELKNRQSSRHTVMEMSSDQTVSRVPEVDISKDASYNMRTDIACKAMAFRNNHIEDNYQQNNRCQIDEAVILNHKAREVPGTIQNESCEIKAGTEHSTPELRTLIMEDFIEFLQEFKIYRHKGGAKKIQEFISWNIFSILSQRLKLKDSQKENKTALMELESEKCIKLLREFYGVKRLCNPEQIKHLYMKSSKVYSRKSVDEYVYKVYIEYDKYSEYAEVLIEKEQI